LTGFEVGNAIWRLCLLEKKISQEEAYAFLSTVSDFLSLLETIPLAELDSRRILNLAIENRLTFYDASYIAAADFRKLTLVTDDATLAVAAEKFVKTKKSTQL